MALVVEDGTGLATANAYIAVAFADGYHKDRCNDGWRGPASKKEAAIIRATEWIDRHFDFQGGIAKDTQALAWPREEVTDEEARLVDSQSVPVQVQRACAEVALVALENDLQPTVTGGRVDSTSESVGRVSITTNFAGGGAAQGVEIPIARSILDPLLARGAAFGPALLNRA